MFRVGKPSISRFVRDKTKNNINSPEARSPIQNAVVPEIPSAEPASMNKSVPQPFKQETQKPIQPPSRPPPLPLEQNTAPDTVSPWDSTLNDDPFFSEASQEENLFRDVREDRKIAIGDDPLLSDIMDMFSQDASNK